MKKQSLLPLCGLLGVCSSLTAGTVAVPAGKGKIPVPGTPVASPWDVSLASGLSMAKGNSDNLALSAQFLATYVTPQDEFKFSTDYFYGENESVTNQNRLTIQAALNHNLNENFYLGLGSSYRFDEITDLDYRIGVGPVLGYRLINTDATKLTVEAGVGYVWEKQDGLRSDYFAFNAAQHFAHTLASGAKIGENVTFSSELSDFNNFLLTADLFLEVPFSAHWAFRSSVGTSYDNTPANGQNKNDLFVLAGLSYSAQGFAPAPPAARPTLFAKRAPAVPPTTGWTQLAAAGVALNSGNNDNLLATVSYDATFRDANHEIFLGLGGAYGETESNVTQQEARASAQYNQLLSETFFVGGLASLTHNNIAGVDYRFTPAAVLGAYLVKTDATKISVEAGPAYVFEKTSDGSDSYFALTATQKASIALSNTISLGESVTYSPDASKFDSYTLSGSLFVDFYLADNLALRAAVTDTYDSTPSTGRDENDFTLSTGLAIQF
jgi:putative salt-induced outer membrane protein